ncbi:MAG: ATP-binding protein [Flavobacterium sp.]|uniref:ATP-binding protein n=1 Tax=Flavobacterium sp. TaxID=239 RepID=UPI0032672F83
METWKEKALTILRDSLYPVPIELNELDWKSGLSSKTDRLAQHICAFANLQGGGLLVYGVNNDASLFSVSQEEADKTVTLLGNIAKNNLSTSISLEHSIMEFRGFNLLFIHIPEQPEKPAHLRGNDLYNCYTRSAGQTIKMNKKQVQILISQSRGIPFEEINALENLSETEVLKKINYQKLFELLDKNTPKNTDAILNTLVEYKFINKKNESWSISNLGAILFANDINDFPDLNGRNVIVRQYVGSNNRELEKEQNGVYGYAAGFEGMINYILKQLPKTEIIEGIRKDVPIYPKVAIREFIANALIHQDFAIDGMPITIEIFSNRFVITNPGAPLNDVNRLLDMPPRSRNEILAQTMLLLGICERRGSGIDRAIEAIEERKLPPVKFEKSESHTKVILFPPKELKEMSKTEKIRACYQHACLLFEDRNELNNQSLRERLGIDRNNSSVASRIIADTFDAGLIKLSDPEITSRKYATYIPYYA